MAGLVVARMNAFLVFLGAGLGGLARHGVNCLALRMGSSFPWGTMAINVSGSVLMGLVVGWFAARGDGAAARLFVATGMLGGYTTFSTFSLEAFMLIERGEWIGALGYVAGSVALGIGGLFLGLYLMRQLL